MNSSVFYNNEKLYRAVRPYSPFIKPNGKISSAAFKNNVRGTGLSVNKQGNRSNNEALKHILSDFSDSWIVSILYGECLSKNIGCKYCPSRSNKFHSQIYADLECSKHCLTNSQARFISNSCVIEFKETSLCSKQTA